MSVNLLCLINYIKYSCAYTLTRKFNGMSLIICSYVYMSTYNTKVVKIKTHLLVTCLLPIIFVNKNLFNFVIISE